MSFFIYCDRKLKLNPESSLYIQYYGELKKNIYILGEISDPCTLPKVIGPCNGFVKQFYYDQRSDSCYEFDYSGCQGNKNRFQDRESCERQCRRQPAVVTPEVTRGPPIEEPKSPICLAPVDSGDCDDSITAYYYDAQHQMCQAFIYGGCGGNANKFQTEEQCERLCGRFHGQGKKSHTKNFDTNFAVFFMCIVEFFL